jgi:hypothetical protein
MRVRLGSVAGISAAARTGAMRRRVAVLPARARTARLRRARARTARVRTARVPPPRRRTGRPVPARGRPPATRPSPRARRACPAERLALPFGRPERPALLSAVRHVVGVQSDASGRHCDLGAIRFNIDVQPGSGPPGAFGRSTRVAYAIGSRPAVTGWPRLVSVLNRFTFRLTRKTYHPVKIGKGDLNPSTDTLIVARLPRLTRDARNAGTDASREGLWLPTCVTRGRQLFFLTFGVRP